MREGQRTFCGHRGQITYSVVQHLVCISVFFPGLEKNKKTATFGCKNFTLGITPLWLPTLWQKGEDMKWRPAEKQISPQTVFKILHFWSVLSLYVDLISLQLAAKTESFLDFWSVSRLQQQLSGYDRSLAAVSLCVKWWAGNISSLLKQLLDINMS